MLRRFHREYSELKVQSNTTPEQELPATPTPLRIALPASPLVGVQPPALVGKALVVDQDAQVLRIYEEGIEIRTLPASTGVPPLYTPAFSGYVGHYVSTIYGYGGWADSAWYVFTAGGNIYVHSAPYGLSGDVKVYEGLEFLGKRPSSHGCIRLHPADAEWFTTWNPQGVPILITPLDLSKEW
jgi:lipoprotein-anchoring transpeptidase ErfK/SrfK